MHSSKRLDVIIDGTSLNRMKKARLAFVPLVLVGLVSCASESSKVPVGEPAENIRQLALAYVQFAASNQGVGPPNQEALKKFLIQEDQLSEADADARFISSRDSQPYVVRWGERPEGSGPMGPEPPKPPIIIYERVGVDGKRYVANGRMSILQLASAEFSEAVPNAETE